MVTSDKTTNLPRPHECSVHNTFSSMVIVYGDDDDEWTNGNHTYWNVGVLVSWSVDLTITYSSIDMRYETYRTQNNRFICVNLSSELLSAWTLECVGRIKKREREKKNNNKFSLWESGIEFFSCMRVCTCTHIVKAFRSIRWCYQF